MKQKTGTGLVGTVRCAVPERSVRRRNEQPKAHLSAVNRGEAMAFQLLLCFLATFLALSTGAGERVDLTRLQCGNLIYAGNKSSVCFSDKFLSDVAHDTSLNVGRNF